MRLIVNVIGIDAQWIGSPYPDLYQTKLSCISCIWLIIYLSVYPLICNESSKSIQQRNVSMSTKEYHIHCTQPLFWLDNGTTKRLLS